MREGPTCIPAQVRVAMLRVGLRDRKKGKGVMISV